MGPDTTAVVDDPEGVEVFADVVAAWDRLPKVARERIHVVSLSVEDQVENAIVVNALQRRADVVIQKSLAEGFGLTVAEAMWKERPVVGSRVGGIQDQIQEGASGLLVDPSDLESTGRAISSLVSDAGFASAIGHAARKRVRERRRGPRLALVSTWLNIGRRVSGCEPCAAAEASGHPSTRFWPNQALTASMAANSERPLTCCGCYPPRPVGLPG